MLEIGSYGSVRGRVATSLPTRPKTHTCPEQSQHTPSNAPHSKRTASWDTGGSRGSEHNVRFSTLWALIMRLRPAISDVREVASGELARRDHLEWRLVLRAAWLGARAARTEAAARGRRCRRWQLGHGNAVARHEPVGVRLGDGVDQEARVGVRGMSVDRLGVGDLAYLAEIHDGDPV